MTKLERAKKALTDSETRKAEAVRMLEEAAEDISADDLAALEGAFTEAADETDRAAADVKLQERIATAKAEIPAGSLRVKESLTYERGNPSAHYFSDMFKARNGNAQALERLNRNNREVEVETGETRALNSTANTGGEFVPPIWMGEYIQAPAAGRPFANKLPKLPLPAYGGTVNWPRLTSNSSVAVHTDGGAVSATDPGTDSLAVAIKLIAGQNDMSRELLERSHPGMDEAVLASLVKVYNRQVDKYCLSQASVGVLTSATAVTYTDATPTGPELFPFFGQALSQVATALFEPADAIFMHSRRWYWLTSILDGTNQRPWIVPAAQNPMNAAAELSAVAAEGPVGSIAGVPVILDQNIPTTDGASTNQDSILVSRLDNAFLMEDGVRRFTFQEVLSNTAQIRLQVVGYVGFGVYHNGGNAAIVGTGLTAPAGF